jgi:hypothetical protein
MADRSSQLKLAHGLEPRAFGKRDSRRTSPSVRLYRMKTSSAMLAVAVAVLAWPPLSRSQIAGSGSGARRALLVGINLYQPEGTKAQHPPGCQGGRCDLPVFGNLDGSINDVTAMRDLLGSPKFGFEAKNIAVLTNPELPATSLPYVALPASQTAHDGLLAAMQEYLVDVPQPGDTVVFYYAGHGSLRVNSLGTKLAMMVDGRPSHADSTLVPSDAWTGGFDVRDREMTRIFHAALDKGVKLTVLLDSCHSGAFTRGVEMERPLTERSLGYDPRDIKEGPELLADNTPKPAPSQRSVNPALIFSAAQQDQTAKEREFGDAPETAVPHGAFTVALIRALQRLPADAPASVVYRQVRATMEGEGIGDQTPEIDASKNRLSQPLFGGKKSDLAKTRAAVIGVDNEGSVLLDAGLLSGIRVGNEFASLAGNETGNLTTLRVESLEGITHARAKVISPPNATIDVGQVFELTKWVPHEWSQGEIEVLHFWTWPATLTEDLLNGAIDAIKVSGFTPVEDPVEQPWTDMLAWNGAQWQLKHAARVARTRIGPSLDADALKLAGKLDAQLCVNESVTAAEEELLKSLQTPAVSFNAKLEGCQALLNKQNGIWFIAEPSTKYLGSTLTAESLKRELRPNARLWANLPPPRELSAKLALKAEGSLVQGVGSMKDADYILAGTLTANGPQWAWYHKAEFALGPNEVTKDHSPGCSTHSPYPVSSDWAALPGPASLPDASSKLNEYAAQLAKINGWLNLPGDQSVSESNYYKLIFKRVADKSVLPEGEAARQDERLKMYLSADSRVTQKRWVYVLDIDCHGKGTLLYPVDTAENRFPNDADTPHEFELPGAPTLRIGAPFGVDTVLLISTQEPLPDPYALNFEGVGTRNGLTRGEYNPLQQLLSSASSGTRGAIPDIPTNWSIDAIPLLSAPKKEGK